jgi:hypothetical protein
MMRRALSLLAFAAMLVPGIGAQAIGRLSHDQRRWRNGHGQWDALRDLDFALASMPTRMVRSRVK